MDPTTAILLLETGWAHCRVTVEGHGSLLAVLFATGLAGGFTHCAGMCGPFVLGQVATRLEAVPIDRLGEWHRLRGAVLLPYHLGRATTYTALGALAAALLGQFGAMAGVRWLSMGLLGLAAGGFLVAALARTPVAWWTAGHAPSRLGRAWNQAVNRLARPLFGVPGGPGPVGWRGYGLGLALGLLPCGLVYGALAAAAATADPLAGAAAMAAFAAGTMPVLVAIGLAGHAAGQRWRGWAGRATPALLAINGVVLGALAWRMAVAG